MVNIRNIILIGRTGGGKSTLGNVLINKNDNFEEAFEESAGGVSKTKNIEERVVEINLKDDGSEKIRYRVIDTIGLGDTSLTPQGVLMRLAEIVDRVKKEGLNQILFINKGRFTKEEIETYDLLSSIIFDKEVLRYTTVVRVAFPNFEDQEVCDKDRWELREENPKLAHILNSVKVIYLDNPPLEGRAKIVEINKEVREESRKRLLTYLATCQGNYRPSNIDTLDKRVEEYRTNEQLLKDKMKELEKNRKEQAEKFRKDMAELKEQKAKDLREMRAKATKDLHDLEVSSDEKLRKTKNELEDKQKKDMDEQNRKNEKQLRQSEERSKQDIKKLEDAQEQQKKGFQEDLRKNKEKLEEVRIVETENRKKELEIEEKRTEREQDRLDAESKEKINKQKEETKIARERADREAKEHAEQEQRSKRNVFQSIHYGIWGQPN